jgi:hypothetical protein
MLFVFAVPFFHSFQVFWLFSCCCSAGGLCSFVHLFLCFGFLLDVLVGALVCILVLLLAFVYILYYIVPMNKSLMFKKKLSRTDAMKQLVFHGLLIQPIGLLSYVFGARAFFSLFVVSCNFLALLVLY